MTKKTEEAKPKGPSYQTKIKEFMDKNNGVATRDALLKATGADSKNLSVAVSILKNPDRIKKPMNVVYLRGNTTFYNLDNAGGKKAYEAALAVMDAAKANAKKVKTKAASAKAA